MSPFLGLKKELRSSKKSEHSILYTVFNLCVAQD